MGEKDGRRGEIVGYLTKNSFFIYYTRVVNILPFLVLSPCTIQYYFLDATPHQKKEIIDVYLKRMLMYVWDLHSITNTYTVRPTV